MHNYCQIKELQTNLRGVQVTFFSKPGLSDWDRVTPAAQLMAEQTTLARTDKALYMGCGHGAVAVVLSGMLPQGALWLTDSSVIALQCAKLTLDSNHVQNATFSETISLLPEHAETFNAIMIDLPKGRQLGRRYIFEAYSLLVPGGILYLAGANVMGIQSLIKDAQALFGNSGIVGYKKGSRLARFIKDNASSTTKPGWVLEPGIAPGTWSSFDLELEGEIYSIHALPGVFSQNQLDDGTRLLLQHIPIIASSNVLDVGCGSGVIGIVTARRMQQSGQTPNLEMVDADLLAVASAVKNVEVNKISGVRVYPSDLLDARHDKSYDLIISNPPFHAGRETNYAISEALITQSHAALRAGGLLVLVANRFIRYNKTMEKIFSNVQVLHQDAHYHVLAATKST